MSLSFMQILESADKVRLIESYAYKASMAFYAMRSMSVSSDKYVTPDGGDGLPKIIVEWVIRCGLISTSDIQHVQKLERLL